MNLSSHGQFICIAHSPNVRIPRIHSSTDLQAPADVFIDATAYKHIKEVLRLKCGDKVILFNGDGWDYLGEITALLKNKLHISVISKTQLSNESPFFIHLLQPLCRTEKMDWCLQKATELGVSKITPVITERVNINIPNDRLEKRINHWHAVINSACEQSGRAKIPFLQSPALLEKIISVKLEEQLKIIAVPDSINALTPAGNENTTSCICLIGPEGGFTSNEIALTSDAGFNTISLGPRILRLETAVVSTITLLQSTWGDLQ